MKCLLCNKPNIDTAMYYPYLKELIHSDAKVLILNFYHEEGWIDEVSNHQKNIRHFVDALQTYHVPKKNMIQVRPDSRTRQEIVSLLRQADVLYLTADRPEALMHEIHLLDLQDEILRFRGLLIGDAIGAMVFCDEYESIYDYGTTYDNGLGIFTGFSLDSMYVEDCFHLGRIIRILEDTGKNILAFNHKGALLVMDGYYELLGDAFVIGNEDIDRIYQAYQDARSRQEYYGDNGNYEF